jgi:hypothetical protein
MAMLVEPTGDQPGRPSKASTYKSKYKKPKISSKKVQKPKLIRVLLYSGSDGDLLFHKKGTPKCLPYTTRQVPKTWCTSNGNFHTEGRGKLELAKVCLYTLMLLNMTGTSSSDQCLTSF